MNVKAETTNDPTNYRRCSEPFADVEKANEALVAFFAEVKAACEKHRIADIAVLVEISHMLDGEEVRGSASSFHGDSARTLPMLAREFGAAQQRHEDQLALMIARARKAARVR